MKYDVVIVASGKGIRSHLGYNKTFFIMKDQKTVLDKSIDIFLKDDDCLKIIVVTNKEYFDLIKKDKKIVLAVGGKERIDSVRNGLELVDSEYVLIHDGARPFIKQENINDIKEALGNYDAVCLGVMASDTVKLVKDGIIIKTINRDEVFLAQTPQAFKTSLLKQAYSKIGDKVLTDDVSIVEEMGYKVKIVLNKYDNRKLTKEEDFNDL